MSGDKQGEFRRALGKLSFLNTMIIHEKKEYIIYFQPMENKGKCKIQVTNGFDFWVEDFDYDKFEQKRQSLKKGIMLIEKNVDQKELIILILI